MSVFSEKVRFSIVVAASFLLVLLLNLMTPMIADDYLYSFSFETRERIQSVSEIIPSLAAHATQMNGRLSPHFFVHLFTMLPRPVFSVINALVYMAFTMGLYRLACGSQRKDVSLLVIIQSAVFLLPPAFGQSFLWLAGSLNYLWCLALMVAVLIPIADHFCRGMATPKRWEQVLLCMAALLMGNASENVALAALLLMCSCMAWLVACKRRIPLWMGLCTLCAALGWAALMLSPGNRASIGRSSGGLGALYIHLEAALQMLMTHGLWPCLFFLALLCVCGFSSTYNRDKLFFAVGLFLAALLCNFSMIASDYYPKRAFTGTCVLLIAACGVLLSDLPYAASALFKRILAVCLAFVMALTAMGALPHTLDRFLLANARVAEVISQKEAGVQAVTTFGIAGNSKYDGFMGLIELTNLPEHFLNQSFAAYYGVESVTAERME